MLEYKILMPWFELLGCCTAATSRSYTEHESQRIEAAGSTIRLIASVRLPFAKFYRCVASYATPKLCYGWIARSINDKDLWKFWSGVRFGDGVCRMANGFARALVLGGCSHPEVITAKHLLRAVVGCSERSLARWSALGATQCASSEKCLRALALTRPVLGSLGTMPVLSST